MIVLATLRKARGTATRATPTERRLTADIRTALEEDFAPERWADVVRALEHNDFAGVERAILGDKGAPHAAWIDLFVRSLGGVYESAANDELARVGSGVRLELFEKAAKRRDKAPAANRYPKVPHSDAFIREKAAALVTRVTEDQRDAIRQTLITRFNNERRPESLVRDLKNVVGLDSRRAQALNNFENKLRESEAKPSIVNSQVARYRERLLQDRAETISRTESTDIEAEARHEAWDIARDAGDIPDTSEVEWVSSGDPCPFCEEMDGQRVDLGESFQSPQYGEVDHPPLHPRCRCLTLLRTFRE